jgi:hypothetical protein
MLSVGDKGLMVQIFLNENMQKNDYGETVFYHNNDVMCGIHQHPGRVLVWNDTIQYIPKPPAMLFIQTQSSLVLQLTNSDKEHKSCMELNKVSFDTYVSTSFYMCDLIMLFLNF